MVSASAIENQTAGEIARVSARNLIADITSPISKLRASFSAFQRGLTTGSIKPLFDSAFASGAQLMVEEVKANCPVKSGELRDSIYYTTEDISGDNPEVKK